MPIFIGNHHLLHNLLYVLVGSFHCTIYLRYEWRRVVMLDFELRAEFNNHGIVEVGSVVSDNPFRDVVSLDEVMLDKPGYNVLSD